MKNLFTKTLKKNGLSKISIKKIGFKKPSLKTKFKIKLKKQIKKTNQKANFKGQIKKMDLIKVGVAVCLIGLFSAKAYANAPDGKVISGYVNKSQQNITSYVRYYRSSVEPMIVDGGFFDQLLATLNGLGEYKNLIIEVVGHSDNERMSDATKAKFGSNQNLSKLRARKTVERIRENLVNSNFDISNVTFNYKGMGATQPLVPNTSKANRAKNRRAEINIAYEAPIYKDAPKPVAKQPESKPAVSVVPVPVPAVNVTPKVTVTTPQSKNPVAKVAQKEVEDALAVKADDEDGNSLKEALTSVDKNYSLIKRGELGFQYGYNFTYSASESLALSDGVDSANGARYVTDISSDSRYTHRANISASYGLLDNITIGGSLPVVSTHRNGGVSTDEITDTNMGDLNLNTRWQPWETRLGKINTTFGASVSLPTGMSPYKIDTKNTLPTGSGTYGFGLSSSFSKVIDPIIAYGGVSLSHSLPIEKLSQLRGGKTLVKVEPQPSMSYSMGLGYALSYGVSVNLGFQHSFASRTKLYFSDGLLTSATGSLLEQEVVGGHSAMINTSFGFRTSPGSVVSVTVGAGLTNQAPDFSVGVTVPFSFKGFK